MNNEASGGAEQRRATARAYQRLAPAVYAGVVLKRDEVDLDESWRKLQRAEALRDARFIVEAKGAADELSCAVCGLKLADSDALTEARLGGGGQKGNLRPVYSSKDGRLSVTRRSDKQRSAWAASKRTARRGQRLACRRSRASLCLRPATKDSLKGEDSWCGAGIPTAPTMVDGARGLSSSWAAARPRSTYTARRGACAGGQRRGGRRRRRYRFGPDFA